VGFAALIEQVDTRHGITSQLIVLCGLLQIRAIPMHETALAQAAAGGSYLAVEPNHMSLDSIEKSTE